MTQVKTKIWRGGLAGAALPAGASTGPVQEVLVQPSDGAPASPSLSQTRVVSPAGASPPWQADLPSVPTPLPTVIRPPSPMQSTRIMPVEALLAPLENKVAPAAAEPVVPPRNPLGMRLLIAGLLVFTLGIWVAPALLEPEEESAPPASHVRTSRAVEARLRARERRVAPQGKPADAPAFPAIAQATPAPVRSPDTAPRGRAQRGDPRAAADALASGDYPLAAALYGRLAAAHPEQPAYSQAARILEQRLTSSR